jgi:hypothetical protein
METMMRFLQLVLMTLLLSACVSSGGQRITDFSDRSVVYGWLDIEDVDANRLHNVTIFQFLPRTNTPYYNVKVTEFEDGYLYYAFSFAQGSYGLYSAAGQQCFGLCGNTIYEYDFGKQGDNTARVRVTEPGVYSMGAYKLVEVDTGFFEQGKFEVVPTKQGPSDHQMLEAMLKDAEDKPQIAARIRAAMRADEV